MTREEMWTAAEGFAKELKEYGSVVYVEFALNARSKAEFMKNIGKISPTPTLAHYVSIVNALPFDVKKEERGTDAEDFTASYFLALVRFNFNCK